jgi:hypothetical protein
MARWGPNKSVMAGDYILAVSSRLLAQTGEPEVRVTSEIRRGVQYSLLCDSPFFKDGRVMSQGAALQRKSLLCITVMEIVRPQSQFHIFMCL